MTLIPFTPAKYAYHLTYPKLTAIITSGTLQNPNAMAASWHTHLSFDPPLYGVSIAPKRYTYKLIKKYGDFGVNFLPFELAEKVWLTGTYSGLEVDKFEKFGLQKLKAAKINASLIAQSTSALECKVVDEVVVGDHVFFVGEIVYAWCRQDILANKRGLLKPEKAKQIYYLGEGVFLTIDPETRTEFE